MNAMNEVNNENESRVVSTDIEEIWKDIPGYTFKRYSASNLGNIRRETGIQVYKILIQHECKTSVGTYLNVCASSDTGKSTSKGAHQLICLAFRGYAPDDGLRYEVNHIDGNKHNNREDNLEWNTRSENTLHALKSGLRNDNLTVDVYDDTTKVWTTYYSIVELSRVWNLPRNTIKKLIAHFSDKLYLNRWMFRLDKSRLAKINREHHSEIYAFDHISNKLVLAFNATDMYYAIGIHSTTILVRLRRKDPTMIGGYSFRYRDKSSTEKPTFLEYTKEEAILSKELYFKNHCDIFALIPSVPTVV